MVGYGLPTRQATNVKRINEAGAARRHRQCRNRQPTSCPCAAAPALAPSAAKVSRRAYGPEASAYARGAARRGARLRLRRPVPQIGLSVHFTKNAPFNDYSHEIREFQIDFPTNCITKFASVLMLFSPGILGALARTLSLDNTKAALARCEIRKKG